MKNARAGLPARYLTALRRHMARRQGARGDLAQGLGRAALAGGRAVRDLSAMHQMAVAALVRSHAFSHRHGDFVQRAGFFFNQALIPVDAALLRGNRRLEHDAAALREGQVRYRKLVLESRVMQRKLRQLTRQIIAAHEEERKEISRELHDEVVQTLVGINVQLSALGQGASTGLHTLKAKIVRTQRLVEKSVKAVHRFARELRPAVLDDLGLIPALQAFSENLAARKKIRIRIIAFNGVDALSGPRRTVLFRVAQEALTNVARHAQASEVRLTLSEVPGAIRMEITDNGKAFEVDKVMAASGRKRLGLIGMKERMEMVGGNFVIKSSAGAGTTVRAELPSRLPKTKS